MNQNKNFKTQSLALASALQAISTSKLNYIDSTNPTRAEFVFDRSKDPSFDEIVQKFWSRQLLVDAATYFDAQRLIKTRLYENKC